MGLLWAFLLPFGRMAQEAFNISRNFWLTDWSEAGLDENRTVSECNVDTANDYDKYHRETQGRRVGMVW